MMSDSSSLTTANDPRGLLKPSEGRIIVLGIRKAADLTVAGFQAFRQTIAGKISLHGLRKVVLSVVAFPLTEEPMVGNR